MVTDAGIPKIFPTALASVMMNGATEGRDPEGIYALAAERARQRGSRYIEVIDVMPFAGARHYQIDERIGKSSEV